MTSSDEAADGLKMSSFDTGRVHHTIPLCVALLSFRLCLLSESQSKQSSTPWRRSSSSPAARFLSFVPLQFFFWEEKTVVLFSYYKSFLPLFAHTHTHTNIIIGDSDRTGSTSIALSRGHAPLIHLPDEQSASKTWNIVPHFTSLWSRVCVFHSAHELLQKC